MKQTLSIPLKTGSKVGCTTKAIVCGCLFEDPWEFCLQQVAGFYLQDEYFLESCLKLQTGWNKNKSAGAITTLYPMSSAFQRAVFTTCIGSERWKYFCSWPIVNVRKIVQLPVRCLKDGVRINVSMAKSIREKRLNFWPVCVCLSTFNPKVFVCFES